MRMDHVGDLRVEHKSPHHFAQCVFAGVNCPTTQLDAESSYFGSV